MDSMLFSQNSVVLLTQKEYDDIEDKTSVVTLFFSDLKITKLWGAVASQTPGPIFIAVKSDKTMIVFNNEVYNGPREFDSLVNFIINIVRRNGRMCR